jgi:hypothetical protein
MLKRAREQGNNSPSPVKPSQNDKEFKDLLASFEQSEELRNIYKSLA